MKLRHGSQESPDINLTPLIDVVFLLLIFFMVSTTFQRDAELTIELPEAGVEKSESQQEPIDVAIDYRGRFYVNGRQLVNTQMASLKAALKQAAAKRESPPLVISADAQTPHQAVIMVMDAARQLGFLRLSFATRVPSAGEGGTGSGAE
jgi:biopolymer transport protein ExbD